MNDHSPDCRIHEDGSCCDCGVVAASKPAWRTKSSTAMVFAGTMMYSGAVYAAPAGPSWEIIAAALFGLAVSGVGWYAKGVSVRQDKTDSRVDRLEEKLTEVNTNILRDYHSKQDMNEILGEIKSSMKALHQRFDKFEGLYGR